jgi:hypothetical protein
MLEKRLTKAGVWLTTAAALVGIIYTIATAHFDSKHTEEFLLRLNLIAVCTLIAGTGLLFLFPFEKMIDTINERKTLELIEGKDRIYKKAVKIVKTCSHARSCQISTTDLYPTEEKNKSKSFHHYIDAISKEIAEAVNDNREVTYRLVAHDNDLGKAGLSIRHDAFEKAKVLKNFHPRTLEGTHPLEVLIVGSSAYIAFPGTSEETLHFAILVKDAEFAEFIERWYTHFLWQYGKDWKKEAESKNVSPPAPAREGRHES